MLTISSTTHADSTLTLQADSGNATLKVKNGRISIKSNDPDNTAQLQNINVNESIFDTTTQTLYLIDHSQRTMSPVTKATIEQLGSTIDAAVGVLDSMPTEQRDTISDLMRGFGIAVPESEPNQAIQLEELSTQEFRGIKCQENSVIEGGQELGRVCITQENSTPLSLEDYQSLLNAQNFFMLIAKQAKPFAEQYGQSIPNLDGIELSGLVVYSNQTQVNPETPSASFMVTGIDLRPFAEITIPNNYESRPLLYSN